jgi:hypothetical protein
MCKPVVRPLQLRAAGRWSAAVLWVVAAAASAQELGPAPLATESFTPFGPSSFAPTPSPRAADLRPSSTARNAGGPHNKAGSEHIRDNGFLVEEAFNQEKNEIQHIFNWIPQWNRVGPVHGAEFVFAYTIDIPLGSQKHELSFMSPLVGGYENLPNGLQRSAGGLGDTMINYRYQLLASDDFLWCTPRATVIVPTGDNDRRLGTGTVGYEFYLPISRYGKRFDWHFNIGYTYFPTLPGAVPAGLLDLENSLQGYGVGGTVLWKPRYDLHFFLETLALGNVNFDDDGRYRRNYNQLLLNPGLRYGVVRLPTVEWVVGASIPIGLTQATPDVGLFLYLSLEHAVRGDAVDASAGN